MMRTILRFSGSLGAVVFLSSCFFGGGGSSAVAPAAKPRERAEDSIANYGGTGTREFADGIAATVNGQVITKSEVRDAVARQRMIIGRTFADRRTRERELKKVEREGLKALIDRALIISEYDKKGSAIKEHHIDGQVNYVIREIYKGDRQAFIDDLRKSRTTLRSFREDQAKQIKVMAIQQNITRGKVPPPSPQEIENYYRKNLNDFREEGQVKVRMITIPKRSTDPLMTPQSQKLLANDIRQKITNTNSFAEAARKYSQDSYASAGGDRGYIDRSGPLNAQFTEVAFSLAEGETSPIFESPTSYFIMHVEDKRYGKATPLAEVRDEIERRVLQEEKKALVDQWVDGMRKRAQIRIY